MLLNKNSISWIAVRVLWSVGFVAFFAQPKSLPFLSWPLHWQDAVGLRGKVLVAGGYRGGFCEKLREASPMSDQASASRFQDGPAAGQGQANQRWW